MARRLTLYFFAALFVIIGLIPVAAMFFKTIYVNDHFTVKLYVALFSSSREWGLVGNSVMLAFFVTAVALLAGIPLGVVLSKTDLPFKGVFTFLFTIPLLLPPYITAIAWSYLIKNGNWFFGLPGCVLILSLCFLPIVMFLTMTYLKSVNPSMEEAGKLSSGWFGVLKNITLPAIMPGILLSAVLVFLFTLGEFSVPNYLRYKVFSNESFTQFSAIYDFNTATVSTMPLLLIAFAILLFEAIYLHGKTQSSYGMTPDSNRSLVIGLKSSKKWILILLGLAAFILIGLPLAALVREALNIGVLKDALAKAGDSLLRSMSYAGIGATILAVMGFFLGYLIYKKALPVWRGVDMLTLFLLALPSAVTGIGLISFWNKPATNFIYGTPAIIILGYVACYTVLTSRMTISGFSQISSSIEEVAEISGISWWRRVSGVLVPLMRRSLLASWLIAYIFCLRDVGVTMSVYPPGNDTLPIRIFTLMANASSSLIAGLCLIMILSTLIPFSFFMLSVRKKGGA
jgi:iron(III) transport system permease protein